jgi:transcriptional regulator
MIDKIESVEETLSVVQSIAQVLEAEFGWDMSGSIDYFRQILPAVGAFRFTVTRAEAIFKLSQEQTSETRDRVCRHFAQEGSGRQQETAEYMNRLTEVEVQ